MKERKLAFARNREDHVLPTKTSLRKKEARSAEKKESGNLKKPPQTTESQQETDANLKKREKKILIPTCVLIS